MISLDKLPAALFEIGKLIGSDLDPGILLSRIAELICQLIDAKSCSVMLLDADRKCLLAKAAYGLRSERMQSLSFRIENVSAPYAFTTVAVQMRQKPSTWAV